MMLSYEEVREVCISAMNEAPDDFEKKVADYIPQTVIPQIMHDVTKARYEITNDLDRAASETATFMMGVHVGWAMAQRAYHAK